MTGSWCSFVVLNGAATFLRMRFMLTLKGLIRISAGCN